MGCLASGGLTARREGRGACNGGTFILYRNFALKEGGRLNSEGGITASEYDIFMGYILMYVEI